MRALRHAARHRRPRHIRLVRARPQSLPLTDVGLSAYGTGITALGLLRTHFPAFFAEHVARLPTAPEKLLGAVAAFFQLVEGRGLALRWPEDEIGDLSFSAHPADTLHRFDGVSAEFLADLYHHLDQIRPRYYGLGVQLLVDEGYSTGSLLRLALYWLLQGTAFDIGIDVPMLLDEARLTPAQRGVFEELRPLPRDVGIHEVLALAAESIPEAEGLRTRADLICFAIGRTSNDLANTNEMELSYIYDGDEADYWSWDQIDELAALSREAQRIDAAFDRWHARVQAEGPLGVERLAELLHRSARTLRRRDRRQAKTASTLLETLGGLSAREAAHAALTADALDALTERAA